MRWSSITSAVMVTFDSSSAHQYPDGCCKRNNAPVARSIAVRRFGAEGRSLMLSEGGVEMLKVLRAAAWVGAAAWIGLVVCRGRFWDSRADGLREPDGGDPAPDVHAVVPARNEADVVARSVASLLAQTYSGQLTLTLVDDRSEDGTAEVADATIARFGAAHRAGVVRARPRPDGWTGKVWAMAEGVAAARARGAQPAYWWFTDADVEHDPATLGRLVATAAARDRALVSQMVELHCVSPA